MKLFISPLSIEMLEAAYITHCDLIPSCSQVGPKGYAFTDEAFYVARRSMEYMYDFKPYVERDHLGKGGEDFYEWLDRDSYFKFDGAMLHTVDRDIVFTIAERYQNMQWQIGGGEDSTRVWQPDWEVPLHTLWMSAPTGCLINGLGNKGEYDAEVPKSYLPRLFRAHNCDYLMPKVLQDIARHCHGLNIAPQIGTIQSSFYLMLGLVQGYPLKPWLDACEADKKNQERWGHPITCGHYHYDLLEWRPGVSRIVTQLLVKALTCLKNEKSVGGLRKLFSTVHISSKG